MAEVLVSVVNACVKNEKTQWKNTLGNFVNATTFCVREIMGCYVLAEEPVYVDNAFAHLHISTMIVIVVIPAILVCLLVHH